MVKKVWIEVIIIFIITFIINFLFIDLTGDEIWNFGFAYNVSNGLIPYKDFNMVITPLYPLLGGLFMSLFGSNIFVFHIFNSIICSCIYFLMKRECSSFTLIPYCFLIFSNCGLPNYSLFCVLLLFIILYFEDTNKNDYLIGIMLGIVFITKQNMGLFLFLPSLFIKSFKRIIKRIIGFIIPVIIIIIYLLCNNCFYEFIDYCFLGLYDFNNNYVIDFSCLYLVIILIYLIYEYFKTRKFSILYYLSFLLIAYPIIDLYHVIIGIVPSICYIVGKNKLSKNVYIYLILFILYFFIVKYNDFNNKYDFINSTNVFKYRKVDKVSVNNINVVTNYINNNKDKKIYIINYMAYIVKLECGIPINKYDLLIDGNLGHGGYKDVINDFSVECLLDKCIFIVDNNNNKYNDNLVKYVTNNNDYIGDIDGTSLKIYISK